MTNDNSILPSDNSILPFIIDDSAVSGRVIRLGNVLDDILTRHNYPDSVATLLGQFIALGAGIATSLKFDGIFTFQARGNGSVPLMVVDITANGDIRGYANVDGTVPSLTECKNTLVSSLMGTGNMMITVDQNQEGGRYQGIVALDKDTLEDCIKEYFEKSAQFETVNRIACIKTQSGWRAGCAGISKLPAEDTKRDVKLEQENWKEKSILLKSIKDEELTDIQLSSEEILHRLYHTAEVKLFPYSALQDKCRCSKEKMYKALKHLDTVEKQDLFKEQKKVEITCQYCSSSYKFNPNDLGL